MQNKEITCIECNCSNCSSTNEQEFTEHENNYYCHSCYEENYKICERCNETHNVEDMQEINGYYYCQECVDEHFITCNHCNDIIEIDESYTTQDDYTLCEYCYSNNATSCMNCGNIYYNEDRNMYHDSNYNYLCGNCIDDYTICHNCEEFVNNDSICFNEEDEEYYCESCYSDIEHENIINPYSYKPDPIFYGNDETYLGIELEIDRSDKSDNIQQDAENILEIANNNNEHIYLKHDGSLDYGCEIVSHPASMYYHEHNFPWKEILQEALDLGYKSHDITNCGLHVHISRSAFGSTETEQELNILKLLYLFEKHWDNLVKFSRRTKGQLDSYARRYETDLTMNDQQILCDIKEKSDNSRYFAVNLQNEHTVEIRIFRGTLKYSTFISCLQLCQHLVEICSILDISNIRNLTWETFCNLNENHKELKEYFNHINS